MMNYSEFTNLLNGYRSSAGNHQGRAFCPCHQNPPKPGTGRTLSVWLNNEDVIIPYCHAGCEKKDVLAALGLGYRDMYSNSLTKIAADKISPEEEAEIVRKYEKEASFISAKKSLLAAVEGVIHYGWLLGCATRNGANEDEVKQAELNLVGSALQLKDLATDVVRRASR